MLVLSRKKGQKIIIGDDIEIEIIDIQGDNVRLGITAPSRVKIYRSEIYREIQAENLKARENLAKLKQHLPDLINFEQKANKD